MLLDIIYASFDLLCVELWKRLSKTNGKSYGFALLHDVVIAVSDRKASAKEIILAMNILINTKCEFFYEKYKQKFI